MSDRDQLAANVAERAEMELSQAYLLTQRAHESLHIAERRNAQALATLTEAKRTFVSAVAFFEAARRDRRIAMALLLLALIFVLLGVLS